MNIPKSFDILGHTYKVKYVKKIDSKGSRGDVDTGKKIIRILKPNKGATQDVIDETFYHEMIHAVLDELEYLELSKDEVFVERVARVLHQVFKSAKY